MKSATLFFSFVVVALFTKSQDSPLIKNIRLLPAGIYKTQKSFFDRRPDIEKKVTPVIHYVKNKKEDSSVAYGFSYKFADSTKTDLAVFAFCDSNDVYIQTEKGVFFKCAGFGRHPYLYVRELSYPVVFLPMSNSLAGLQQDIFFFAFELFDNAVRKKKICLHYFNRKKHLVKATPEGVGFLLKKDKDLFEAYGSEPKKTEAVMLKYINMMNERYPAWEVK